MPNIPAAPLKRTFQIASGSENYCLFPEKQHPCQLFVKDINFRIFSLLSSRGSEGPTGRYDFIIDERWAAPPAYSRWAWYNWSCGPFVLAVAPLRYTPLWLSVMTYGDPFFSCKLPMFSQNCTSSKPKNRNASGNKVFCFVPSAIVRRSQCPTVKREPTHRQGSSVWS